MVLGPELERPNRADVQNRANQTCRGCQVKFYTREALLEHCRMEHYMEPQMERDQGISRASREGAPSTNNSDNRRKEATLAGPPGLQHNDINSPQDDSSGNKASQAAYNGDGETGEMDHLGLNDTSNKEGSLRKNSKNKKEGQKPPRGKYGVSRRKEQ